MLFCLPYGWLLPVRAAEDVGRMAWIGPVPKSVLRVLRAPGFVGQLPFQKQSREGFHFHVDWRVVVLIVACLNSWDEISIFLPTACGLWVSLVRGQTAI